MGDCTVTLPWCCASSFAQGAGTPCPVHRAVAELVAQNRPDDVRAALQLSAERRVQ